MRKFFVAALGSAVALVGFAGSANASATVDLIWADTGTNMIGDPDTSFEVGEGVSITLNVILTAGPLGSNGAGINVDYSAVLGKLAVLGASNTEGGAAFPINFDPPTDTGSRIEVINASCLCPFVGTGLVAGESASIGTVTFIKSPGLLNGTFQLTSDQFTQGTGVIDGGGSPVINPIYNSAFLINVPEPGALSLLILGLGGLGLMGRGRRS